MFKDWVVDVTIYDGGELLCFIPVENIESDNPTFVTGMNLLTSIDGFKQGMVKGIIHEDGQEAVDKWCIENKDLYEKIIAKAEGKDVYKQK